MMVHRCGIRTCYRRSFQQTSFCGAGRLDSIFGIAKQGATRRFGIAKDVIPIFRTMTGGISDRGSAPFDTQHSAQVAKFSLKQGFFEGWKINSKKVR